VRSYSPYKEVLYKGNIPDFAADRIEKASKVGMTMLTIHSNDRLPMSVFGSVNAVIVGWSVHPCIHIDPNTRKVIIVDRIFDTTGVVVAAWNIGG